MSLTDTLNPQKALIFRITHRNNIPWLLRHGLYCKNGEQQDPDFVRIGNADLIGMRAHRAVPIPPMGTLSDYVPFYFTPFSPMLYNIKTGWGGIPRHTNDEIVILVSSLHRVRDAGIAFVFTDRHAYLDLAEYSSELGDLDRMIHWPLLHDKNFRKDPENPANAEHYQAEALIYRHMPASTLLGIICHSDPVTHQVTQWVNECGLELAVHTRAGFYF